LHLSSGRAFTHRDRTTVYGFALVKRLRVVLWSPCALGQFLPRQPYSGETIVKAEQLTAATATTTITSISLQIHCLNPVGLSSNHGQLTADRLFGGVLIVLLTRRAAQR
jgi:hypothetical protein